MLVTKDEACRGRKYFKELIGNDGEREVCIGTVVIELSRDMKKCMGEEDTIKE